MPWGNVAINIQPATGQQDPRYAYGATTTSLLSRTGTVTPTGTYTTTYAQSSPGDDITWDMRGARFESYHDCDAVYGYGQYDTANGGTAATAHEINFRPIRLGSTTPMDHPAIVGGLVEGDQPMSFTWVRMKHGSLIQQHIDDGMDPDEAYTYIINNANQDGDPRMYIKAGSWGVFDGLRVRNSHDGLGMYGTGSRTEAGAFYIRNCWLQDIHDDAVENDEQKTLHVFDTLVERAYGFLSTRASSTSGTPTSNTQTVENCIVRLSPFSGGHKMPSTASTHDLIIKMQTNSPAHVIKNTIIATESPRSSSSLNLPERAGVDSYENVTLVWLGSGAYPGNVPAGCTLTTDASVYNNAAAQWKTRHGVTSFYNVNMTKMLNPDPLL